MHRHCCSDIDDVHDMMDDIQEQNEIAEEISQAMSAPIGFAAEIDEVRKMTSIKIVQTEHYFNYRETHSASFILSLQIFATFYNGIM